MDLDINPKLLYFPDVGNIIVLPFTPGCLDMSGLQQKQKKKLKTDQYFAFLFRIKTTFDLWLVGVVITQQSTFTFSKWAYSWNIVINLNHIVDLLMQGGDDDEDDSDDDFGILATSSTLCTSASLASVHP